MKDVQGQIYLIHFSDPVCPERHTAQHYLGWARDAQERLKNHTAGIVRAARERGLTCTIVRLWDGTRSDERKLKRRKNAPRLCPVCSSHPQPASALSPLAVGPIDQGMADELQKIGMAGGDPHDLIEDQVVVEQPSPGH